MNIIDYRGNIIAMEAALAMPSGMGNNIHAEPKNRRKTQASPEWPHWRKTDEAKVQGLINNGVWTYGKLAKDTMVIIIMILPKIYI